MIENSKNQSFVANRVNIDTMWIFKVRSDAEPSTNVEEAISLVGNIFISFDDFIFPTSTEYVLWVPQSGLSENVPATGEIESSNGITADELITELRRQTGDGIGTFRRLTIDGNLTRIFLEDGEHLIDSTSNRYQQWARDGILEQPPAEDIFRIDVFYSDSSGEKYGSYQIVVRTYTDIWFEETEIGERNRERLAVALDRLFDTIDADSVQFESRIISDHDLNQSSFSILYPGRESE